MVRLLRDEAVRGKLQYKLHESLSAALQRPVQNAGELFDAMHQNLAGAWIGSLRETHNADLNTLVVHGLVIETKRQEGNGLFTLTDTGRRFRNRLLTYGDLEKRLHELWTKPLSGVAVAD